MFPIDFVREEGVLTNSENSFDHHEESHNEEKNETCKAVLESNETILHSANELSPDACSINTNLSLEKSSHKLTLSEASKTTQLSLQMIKIISAEHLCEPLSVQATETATHSWRFVYLARNVSNRGRLQELTLVFCQEC